ncbi:hypothetical protein ACFWJM_11900 [Streptomyces sp. NPDC127077]|uniref:hypothetical protein n=1 Tax=Streptomyces sp. NPDC127077 TaxID=3347131 RepID=UPI003650414A
MNGDEQLLNRRVCGADHDDPNLGPLLHRTYAELVGGPLGGLLLDIHGCGPRKGPAGRHTWSPSLLIGSADGGEDDRLSPSTATYWGLPGPRQAEDGRNSGGDDSTKLIGS